MKPQVQRHFAKKRAEVCFDFFLFNEQITCAEDAVKICMPLKRRKCTEIYVV